QQPSSRLDHVGSAAWRAGRIDISLFGRAVFQLDLRRSISDLGLAHPISAQHPHGWRWSLYPPRDSGNADLHTTAAGAADRANADAGGDPPPAEGDRPLRVGQ